MAKITVMLLFGGKSAEHEISILSAGNIYRNLDKQKYHIELVGITRKGLWYRYTPEVFDAAGNGDLSNLEPAGSQVYLIPAEGKGHLRALDDSSESFPIDCVIPVLHGPFGEDGVLQGVFKAANVPYVGCDVAGSAIGMDKDVMKRLLRDAGIDSAPFVCLRRCELNTFDFDALTASLGSTLFVKPANMGSSVGVRKASSTAALREAVEHALRFDHKVIIEAAIEGKEVECAVLGNESPEAATVGEVVPAENHGFYSYESKYLDEKGAEMHIPARISESELEEVRRVSVEVFQVLGAKGLARVDSFVTPDGKVLVNEINTFPGFTNISLYPLLWESAGLPYAELLDRLITLGCESAAADAALETKGF